MPTVFPTWPNILFGIIEPISLISGAVAPIVDLNYFISGQAYHLAAPATQHPSTVALAYQLANLYGLLFLVGVGVLHSTSEPRVARNYLIACAIADVGHLYATYVAMGWEAYMDVGAWNALAWGNIGFTAFLLLNRLVYFSGAFGEARVVKAGGKME
ncbi:hypothetical protein N7470_005124 [Penicillium chermesinum]|nr:hypothetical protein N7470_005124 [Penicillium chermesinum]